MIVWSYGGGTQSAAIAALILQGKLPRPDIAVIADTSREVTETWDYLRDVVQPALDTIGLTVQVVGHEYSTVDIFRDESALIPAFTRQSGRVGKLPTFCSNEWKRRPIMRWLREQGVESCALWLGISTDEIERMKASDAKWMTHEYPLIDLRVNRHQCLGIAKSMGWPQPPKSRCWMCPNMSPMSWRMLKAQYPDDFAKAAQTEKDIQAIDPDMYLHELGIPLEQAVDQSERQSDMFGGCDSGFCFV